MAVSRYEIEHGHPYNPNRKKIYYYFTWISRQKEIFVEALNEIKLIGFKISKYKRYDKTKISFHSYDVLDYPELNMSDNIQYYHGKEYFDEIEQEQMCKQIIYHELKFLKGLSSKEKELLNISLLENIKQFYNNTQDDYLSHVEPIKEYIAKYINNKKKSKIVSNIMIITGE